MTAEEFVIEKVNSGVSTYNKINAFKRDEWFKLMEEYAASKYNIANSDELLKAAKKDVAYKYLDKKGKVDFESGFISGFSFKNR